MSVNTRGESEITSEILRNRRQHFIDIKNPLRNGIVRLATKRYKTTHKLWIVQKVSLLLDIIHIIQTVNKFPEPTKENTKKKMSHILLDIFDEFFKYDTCRSRLSLFRAIRRISICVIETDNHYSQRFTWFLKKLLEKYQNGEWPELEPWCPMDCWSEPTTQEALLRATQEFRLTMQVGGRNIDEIET